MRITKIEKIIKKIVEKEEEEKQKEEKQKKTKQKVNTSSREIQMKCNVCGNDNKNYFCRGTFILLLFVSSFVRSFVRSFVAVYQKNSLFEFSLFLLS